MTVLALPFFLASCSKSIEDQGYEPPVLIGWARDTPGSKGYDGRSVTYRKTMGETKIRMKLSLLTPPVGEKPDTVSVLRDSALAGLNDARKMSPSLQVLEQTETTFRGFPAILTLTHDQYRDASRERKILRVADGKNIFCLDQTLTGSPVMACARREADAAWKIMSSGLKFENGS